MGARNRPSPQTEKPRGSAPGFFHGKQDRPVFVEKSCQQRKRTTHSGCDFAISSSARRKEAVGILGIWGGSGRGRVRPFHPSISNGKPGDSPGRLTGGPLVLVAGRSVPSPMFRDANCGGDGAPRIGRSAESGRHPSGALFCWFSVFGVVILHLLYRDVCLWCVWMGGVVGCHGVAATNPTRIASHQPSSCVDAPGSTRRGRRRHGAAFNWETRYQRLRDPHREKRGTASQARVVGGWWSDGGSNGNRTGSRQCRIV